jgi:hypothetical protein
MFTNTNARNAKAILALAAALLAACGGGSGGYNGVAAPPTDDHTVAATPSLAFTPASLPMHGEVVVQ